MYLLPQSFVFQATHSSSRGCLSEQRHSSSQSLFGSFRKACRSSSRGRLFHIPLHAEIQFRLLVTVAIIFGARER
ncbi:hypothetical protein D3C71_922600 [compost metagenome]